MNTVQTENGLTQSANAANGLTNAEKVQIDLLIGGQEGPVKERVRSYLAQLTQNEQERQDEFGSFGTQDIFI